MKLAKIVGLLFRTTWAHMVVEYLDLVVAHKEARHAYYKGHMAWAHHDILTTIYLEAMTKETEEVIAHLKERRTKVQQTAKCSYSKLMQTLWGLS